MAPGPSLRKACEEVEEAAAARETPPCSCPYNFDDTVSMEPERKKARMDGGAVAVLALANNAKVVAPYPDWKRARDPQFLKVLHGELDLRKEGCKVEREEWTPGLVHELVRGYAGILLARPRGGSADPALLVQREEWEQVAAQLAGHPDCCKVPRGWKEVRAKFDKLRKRYLSEKLSPDAAAGSSRWPYLAAMAGVHQLTMERVGPACLDSSGLQPGGEASEPNGLDVPGVVVAGAAEPLLFVAPFLGTELLSGPVVARGGKEGAVPAVPPEDAFHDPPQAGSSTSYTAAAAGAGAGASAGAGACTAAAEGKAPECGGACFGSWWCPDARRRSLSLRGRIGRGRVYGAYCASFSPVAAEILGLANYDFVVVDLEYGPCDYAHTLPILHALASTGCPSVLRVPSKSATDVRRALDLGPSGIIFPGVETAEAAEALVETCRASGPRPLVRSSLYGMAAAGAGRDPPNDDVFVICEVSSVAANVADIAAVEGVDCVQLVPLSLQASLEGLFQDRGRARAQLHGLMRHAEDAVLGCTRKTPLYLAALATSELSSATLFSRNYHMVSGAVDISLLRDAAMADVANRFGRARNTTASSSLPIIS